nr:PREDICTED: A disintegrin and metalloproteinase with thrombospondin motifs 12-like isoform X1 [Linepithema humile]
MMILKKETSKKENINNDNTRKNSTIELAVFVDEAAHYMSMFLVEHNDDKLHNMILDYVNRIQAAFNNSSLAVSINITLINLLILRNQPSNLPVSDGNVVELLSSFCTYANSLNSPDDIDPNHWDIALYLTGVKLYENVMVKFETHYRVEKNYNITGRAYHDDACDPLFSCAIVEFRNSYEITSSVDAVYKIGNLLGLTEERNSSDLERNITWSEKSRNKIKNLWEEKICLRDQAKTMISKKKNVDNSRKKLSIQLAVFFDKAAYHMYMPILDNDEDKLRNMILAYVNQIQALLHHSSLGASIDISLVKLVIMNKQLSNLSAFDGDHKKMGKSFCNYVNLLYPIYEIDSLQWDIGLYLTGINLYESEKEQKHYSVVGSSFVNYSCTQILSCALVEIGSTGPNAVSGFATSRIAAHEIGHLLGMQHDNGSFDSTCANGKYIMSEWYFSRGQIAWSECSRNIAKELWKTKECLFDHTRRENTENPNALDHSRYHDLPGREWTAKAQCQLFLRDKDANVVTLHDICQVLQCETPHKYGYFFAGPALDGTHCALEKECRSGKCVPVIEPPLPYCEEDNWSEWTEDSCKSDCLTKSKGVVIKRRSCRHGTNKTASCNGPYYDVVLCNDSRLCSNERHTIAEYTASKCTELSLKIKRQGKKYFKYEPQNESGKQASHVVEKPWRACTIHCLREEKISAKYSLLLFYAPRQDMLDFNIDPYFPDGTWCHEKNGQDYYCRQHYCLPENYSIKE